MLLCIDVGNSQIFGGVYDGEELRATFRRTSNIRASSDEFGTFFRIVLRENGVDPNEIDGAAICSVVPDVVHSLRNCFRKYFRFEPFLLQPGVKTGLKIRYRNPLEVGMQTPASVYEPSPRAYPERLPEVEYPDTMEVRTIKSHGHFRWKKHDIFLSEVLWGEPIGLLPVDDGLYTIYFSHVPLALFDTRTAKSYRLPASKFTPKPVLGKTWRICTRLGPSESLRAAINFGVASLAPAPSNCSACRHCWRTR